MESFGGGALLEKVNYGGWDLKFDRQTLRPLGSLFVLGEVVGEAASHFCCLTS